MQKKIGNAWFFYGRSSGIGIGIHIDKYAATVDFLFWYVGLEFQWN